METNRAPIRVLVLCTGNSCRSIIAEALINALGGGRVVGYSAGSHPAGAVNPGAAAVLKRHSLDASAYHSKSWDEFAGSDATDVDIVITVCDNAAGESCPLWNGAPVTVHWGIADPAAASGDDIEPAFERTYKELEARIKLMLELPLDSLDERALHDALARIHDAVGQTSISQPQ